LSDAERTLTMRDVIVDAVVADEHQESLGLSHPEAFALAPDTPRPIREGARRILAVVAYDRGLPRQPDAFLPARSIEGVLAGFSSREDRGSGIQDESGRAPGETV
jgi:hypothetical protein